MKNLQLLYHTQYQINQNIPNCLLSRTGGADTNNTIFLKNKNEILALNTVTGNSEVICKVATNIICAEHLDLKYEICMALETGEVMTYNLSTKQYEEVSYCEGGIETMSWSPDQEVVIFVTKAKTLVVMTSTYDPICESNLDDTSVFGDGEFITIGWGKKETQFHGSEGKQAAKQKLDFTIPDNLNELPQNVNISWRGDSEWFAISFVSTVNGRMFKTYNKEGVLQFTSEKHNNLGDCLSWRPNGNWISIPHKFPNKYTIALFEKNGLRHREIVLPFKSDDDETIVNVSWSSDSDVLAIETLKQQKHSQIYLYTMSNYHWYLKQFLNFEYQILDTKWDLRFNEGKTFNILLENGEILIYKWTFTTMNSIGNFINNQSVLAVVDGRNIHLTDFRNKVVPPPMYSYSFENLSYINAACFLHNTTINTEDCNQIMILDSNDNLSFYELNFEQSLTSKNFKDVKLKYQKKLKKFISSKSSHWLWLNENTVIYCENNKNHTKINMMNIKEEDKICCHSLEMDGVIGSLCSVNANEFVISFINGETHKIHIENTKLIQNGIWFNYDGEFCEKMACAAINDEFKLISLTENANLYINKFKISNDVTSFFVSNQLIAFTEYNCLKFYSLKNEKIIDERKIERGGKLIVIVPCDSKTILQMPRGNLEAIHPHALSLEIIGKMLDSALYSQAMDLLRKQRINLNIIFDHNPKLFLENLDEFLNQISNPQWLNLFLSDLKNEDFTRGMYACNYDKQTKDYPDNYIIENKIKFVCENICEKMITKNYEHFLLPIITTHVKIGNLEKALMIIWSEKKNEIQQNIENSEIKFKPKSEEALKYILYLVDVNELYNVALGLYDFGLVIFVANKSQKDPKEYIPFLNELKQYEENYRKYKIDVHLKRYEKALNSIAKCCNNDTDKFEEALVFITEHKIYQKALIAFADLPECYKQVSLLYGDYLRTLGKFENSSILYERAGLISQAILSAKHVLDWQRCLKLTATLYPGNSEELNKMALSLIPALEQSGKYEEASYILKNFTNNFEGVLSCLLKGKLFLQALFEAKFHQNSELIDLRIVPELLEYGETILTSIAGDSEIFRKHKIRLLLVRKLKEEKLLEPNFDDDVDECDLISDTTSMNSSSKYTGSSKGTGKTFRSSKNRRKHERKLLSLKEGNPFEDIALIDVLYNHITKIFNQQLHIRDTCKALMDITKDDIARNIQQSYRKLLLFVKNSLDEIWIVEMQTTQAHIVGPNIDYAQYQNDQHYAMISPLKRFKPQLNFIDWEHEILR